MDSDGHWQKGYQLSVSKLGLRGPDDVGTKPCVDSTPPGWILVIIERREMMEISLLVT